MDPRKPPARNPWLTFLHQDPLRGGLFGRLEDGAPWTGAGVEMVWGVAWLEGCMVVWLRPTVVRWVGGWMGHCEGGFIMRIRE